ncbi:hypothetical protein BDP27DRAFT_1384442 [Rhodocollybia butyracea]|uniref:Uncharacterized protein n=1 Tax=Rhodocollybia butyracea TaxID=206335 RepID=A0A9P5PQ01_9AGAR|nr:hypothetical protein BDP27DRAFT_1384442 [Rhodocollybia butyracea]
MQRKSVKDHLTSRKHLQNVERTEHRKIEAAEMREKLQRTYHGPSMTSSMSDSIPDVPYRPDMFEHEKYSSELMCPEVTLPSLSNEDLFMLTDELFEEVDVEEQVSQQYRELLDEAIHLSSFGFEEEDGPDPEDSDTAMEEELPHTDEDCEGTYRPYPNMVSMLLDIMDNLPRLRISNNSMKLILWMLKMLGVPRVPSFNKFRGMQEILRKECGVTPDAHISDFQNHYHSIDPRETFARDFANPQVAPHIMLYPEETEGPRGEAWQFDRWKEYGPSQLTPMYSRGLKQFWIDEVSQLKDGSYVLPRNWIMRDKELHSDCSDVHVTPTGWEIDTDTRSIAATQFAFTYDDVTSVIGGDIIWRSGQENTPQMPNPLHKIAKGDDLYVVMLPLWCDDVSGNKSKQYNKHINIYSVNGSLPGRLLQQEYFVNFVSTSPHATSLEQFKSLRDQINATEKDPVRCFNAHTKRMCRAILRVPMLPADNPQQSEEASHIGGNSNHPCRKCNVGGGHKETETPTGYHAFYCDNESLRRSCSEIKEELNNQLKTAMAGVEAAVTKRQTTSGVKDKITEYWISQLLAKARKIKEESPRRTVDSIMEELTEWLKMQPGMKMNPLLDIAGLDPSQDTPVEILHTILLGVLKYVWHMINTLMSDKELELLAVQLQSTDTDGLTVPPLHAAYMVQYRNNLIGKHFKTLMQILPFHMHGFSKVNNTYFELTRAVGALGALLWVPEIHNMDEYLADLDVLVGNVLDAFAQIVPSKILVKMKLHLLVHLKSDIKWFGPLIHYSTEVFEAFNAVFQLCSIFSNHQAPSRDIAFKFAGLNRLKHMLSGGFYPVKASQDEKKWVQASVAIQDILRKAPIIQRHLGWVPEQIENPGVIRFKSRNKAQSIPWSQSKASTYIHEIPPDNMLWLVGDNSKVVASSGNLCTLGSWVFVKASPDRQVIGRICKILLCSSSETASGFITVEESQLGAEVHEDFHCPTLHRPSSTPLVTVKSTGIQTLGLTVLQDVLFRFSAQHDCRLANCQPTRQVQKVQERQVTSKVQSLIEHADDNNFIINMFALHNSTVLRQALPRSLWKPKPLFSDRLARHTSIAEVLVISQTEKRAQTQQKTKETRARNKAAAQKGATGTSE